MLSCCRLPLLSAAPASASSVPSRLLAAGATVLPKSSTSPGNRVVRHEIAEANHTFATRKWRENIAAVPLRWVLGLAAGNVP